MSESAEKDVKLQKLRSRAEAILSSIAPDSLEIPIQKFHEVVHELHTYQIELQLQNEDLRETQERLIEARDRYSDLYDFAPVGYLTISEKGLIAEANLTAAKLLDVERRSLIKKRFSDYIAPEDQDIFYLMRERLLETGERQVCELRLKKESGEVFHVGMVTVVRDDNASGESAIFASISDITEKIKAEQGRQLLERQIQNTRKLESLGILAGGIAHDFNNLLTVILGNAGLLLCKLPSDSPDIETIEEIMKASRRAAELCSQMLAYSGRGRSISEQINLSDIVMEMSRLLHAVASNKAGIMYDLADSLPPIKADAAQIRQLIMSLVTNASEALGDEDGAISISTGKMECDRTYLAGTYLDERLPAGSYVYLEVADTGCGMDKQTLNKMFDPFFSTKFIGRGLGLAALLGIVRGHEGAIKIDSEPGKGTIFRVLFPQ